MASTSADTLSEILAVRRRISEEVGDRHKASDVDLAAAYVRVNRNLCRYVPPWKKWVVYRNGAWHVDIGEAFALGAAKRIRVAIDELLQHDGAIADADKKWLRNTARRAGMAYGLTQAVKLARDHMAVEVDDLDRQPELLNVRNGTIDLRTGELREHQPEDLLSKIAPVLYDASAEAELWQRCLERWQPDADMREYLQRVVGSAATGYPVEHLFINLGEGANGKSKFYGAIQHVLGPYSVVPDKSLLVRTRWEPHPTVKASLFGARMLLAAETDAAAWLADDQVKALVGGDRISGRRMRENDWSFLPTWTAFLHTNHRPRVRGTDVGVWRRLRLIPWDVTIPEPERDERLADRLAAEAAGILAWIVDGARKYLADGLVASETVEAATVAYRSESDLVASFLSDAEYVITGNATDMELSATVLKRHEDWCEDNGLDHRRQWHFTSQALKDMGAWPARKGGGSRVWRGLSSDQGV